MNRVIHFEIQADDTARAAKFYSNVFGWTIEKWGTTTDEYPEYWMVMTAPKDSKEMGINGGLHKRPMAGPTETGGANAFVCTVHVDNFDDIANKIEKAGGKVAMPKFALPGMAWQGYFIDTEGNTFGIHQPDVTAA